MKRRASPAEQPTTPDAELRYFRQFVISALCCLTGMGTIVYVNLLLPASTKQEWFALGGLALAVPAGLFAMYCYLRLLLARFGNFFDRS
jgi:hypothetical protein